MHVNRFKINTSEKIKDEWKKSYKRQSLKPCGSSGDISIYLDPKRELIPEVKQYIDPDKEIINILDVGSGPVTKLGYKWNNKKIFIDAVDINAENYKAFLRKHNINIEHLCELNEGVAERLTELYNFNTFDLIYSSNALDHGYDPMKAIKEMSKLIKPGCYFYKAP